MSRHSGGRTAKTKLQLAPGDGQDFFDELPKLPSYDELNLAGHKFLAEHGRDHSGPLTAAELADFEKSRGAKYS